MIALAMLAALVFAAAGLVGTRFALRLCKTRTPFADGPVPIVVPEWAFAAVAAAVGAASALHGSSPLQLGGLALVTVALCAGAFADFRCGVVPDVCTLLPLAAIAGIAALKHDGFPLYGAAVVGLPFAAAALLSRGRGMGWGDVKLVALGGALLGARDATFAFFGACVAAYAWSMLRRRASQPTAFAPYLIAAVALTLALEPVH
jgi:prepilin signal peptidase PulO-like enzyme (type II secretory pathway)